MPEGAADMSATQPAQACVFCQIVAGTAPATLVSETAEVLAFMNIAPATDGHVLVVPKRHARGIADIADGDLERVIVECKAIAKRQLEQLGCAGVTLFQANEPAGWQSVFHFHVHVVPRYVGDPLVPPWHSDEVTREELERAAGALRS